LFIDALITETRGFALSYDIITMGETMLRFTPPNMQRFEQATGFETHIGGSESNVAIGLARLGLKVAWVSRLTKNPLGQIIANGIRAHGVDTSHIVWTEKDRIGLYFYETGTAPRGGQVIYDRANSAMSQMQPEDLPQALFQPKQTRLLHLSGITLAIGEKAAATTRKAAELAKAAGFMLSFDINYRALLSSPETAVNACHPLASIADILFLPLRDAVTLYGAPKEAHNALAVMKNRYPQAKIVLTLGADGAICDDGSKVFEQGVFPASEQGRLGRGDAFVAGFLYATLSYPSTADALAWGAAAAAYKSSITGDFPLLVKEDLARLINESGASTLLR
jgi:2-dehydro-3-deoxygluconokinase